MWPQNSYIVMTWVFLLLVYLKQLFSMACATLEEVAALKEPFKLEKMPSYSSLSKKEFDRAGSYVEKVMPISLEVWNFMALWIVDTTISIFCIAVLLSSRLCRELDLTMTKFKVSVLVKGLSPIVIFRGTSPKGQDFSPENPTSGILDWEVCGEEFYKAPCLQYMNEPEMRCSSCRPKICRISSVFLVTKALVVTPSLCLILCTARISEDPSEGGGATLSIGKIARRLATIQAIIWLRIREGDYLPRCSKADGLRMRRSTLTVEDDRSHLSLGGLQEVGEGLPYGFHCIFALCSEGLLPSDSLSTVLPSLFRASKNSKTLPLCLWACGAPI
nr:hypothetical protein [Tanacetum cinerariifolium]